MNVDLKRELERRIPDSEIPAAPLTDIRARGRHLVWRRRAAVAGSGLTVAVILVVGAMTLVPERAPSNDGSPVDTNERVSADRVVSLTPDRLRVGDRAELRVHHRAPGGYGLEWILERREGSSWEWNGYLKAGPGKRWEGRFYLPPLAGGMIEDIGFTGPAVMNIRIPELEPGRYRLRTDFIRGGGEPLEERTEWHYAEFEVLEGSDAIQAEPVASLDPEQVRPGDQPN